MGGPGGPLGSKTRPGVKKPRKVRSRTLPQGPQGAPKGHQNRFKSEKVLCKTPPGRVWRRSLEKVVSWSSSETSPYASRTVNTIGFALPTECLQARFWLLFDSIWGAFWTPWAPKSQKSRPGSASKGCWKKVRKNMKKGSRRGTRDHAVAPSLVP